MSHIVMLLFASFFLVPLSTLLILFTNYLVFLSVRMVQEERLMRARFRDY